MGKARIILSSATVKISVVEQTHLKPQKILLKFMNRFITHKLLDLENTRKTAYTVLVRSLKPLLNIRIK